MIKGVSKNIIELNPRGHDYFEKVIIILKEAPEPPDSEELHKYAALLFEEDAPSVVKKRSFPKLLISGLIGTVTGFFMCCAALLFV